MDGDEANEERRFNLINGVGKENEINNDFEDDEEIAYGPYASFDKTAPDGLLLENQCKTTQLIVKKASGKTITRLKKPRDLYAVSSHFSAQMSQRWPSEIQVLAKRPEHVYYVPLKPEMLYKPANDMKPLPRTSNVLGKVVYDNSPELDAKYFTRSKCGGRIVPPKPCYRLQGPDDKTLIFESRFESGNLMRAIKIAEYDYELWLRFDLYTRKHTQWYYFMVQNAQPGAQYRFTIMNFVKAGSLYNDGMRPLLYSEYDAHDKGIGWVRAGTKIKYYQNDIKWNDNGKERNYYSLTWSCSFQNENDTCYFAHCYPYTYSDLQDYLTLLANDPAKSRCCKQRILCRTLAGNHVYVLTITAPSKKRNEAEMKKAIVITARVHPGETNSSWMMKGFIDYLTSNAQDAKVLRENFIFKIVPMLNPDGVVVGNYRCSLAGRDLNRNYKTVLKDSFPPIWHTRAMIRKLREEREIIMYCDLHGHSRKKNIFIYGCENKNEKGRRFWGRVFPAMLAKNAPDKFSLDYCRFRVQKNREGTGRIFMWNFGIPNSFTMEASFCGSSLGNKKGYHFSVADFESMAYQFCDTLLDYCDPDQSKVYFILSEIEGCIKRLILAKLRKDEDNNSNTVDDVDIERNLYLLSEIESDSGGSDSSVSDGLPMQLLHASVPELSRKKRLRTRKERNKNVSKNSKTTNDNGALNSDAASQSKSSAQLRNERRSTEETSPTSAKGRIRYSQRNSSANGRVVPHFVKDRVVEKSKLKKEYLDMLTTSFVNNGGDDLVDLQEIPHCRFTAGISSLYQNQRPCATCERCYRSLSDGSDEEWKNNSSNRPSDQISVSDIYGHMYGSEQNANTVLDLARRITVYNHRLSQSVSRRQGSTAVTPNNFRSLWQHRANSPYEDLELSVTSSESKPNFERRNWSHRSKGIASNRRHFEIRQERRAPETSLYSPRRVNRHFEIKKTKKNLKSNLKIDDGFKASSTEHLAKTVSENLSRYPSARRLPHLKRSEETLSVTSYTEEKQFLPEEPLKSHSDLLTAHSRGDNHKNQRKQFLFEAPRTSITQENDTNSSERTVEERSLLLDNSEVSILKEKMRSCGANGLMSYMLEENNGKKKYLPEREINAPREDRLLAKSSPFLDENIEMISNRNENGVHRRVEILDPDQKFTLDVSETKLVGPRKKSKSFILSNDRNLSSLVRGNSDIQVASDKVKHFLESQEIVRNYERLKIPRSRTNDDLLQQGLVTLNVNLNALPLSNGSEDESKVNDHRRNVNEFFNSQNNPASLPIETSSQRDIEQPVRWESEQVSSLSSAQGNANPSAKLLMLNFSGQDASSKPTVNRTRATKINPPQLRGIRKTPKDGN